MTAHARHERSLLLLSAIGDAPTGSAYFEPGGPTTIGATSGAAPYIAGLIADMQSRNTDMDRPPRSIAFADARRFCS